MESTNYRTESYDIRPAGKLWTIVDTTGVSETYNLDGLRDAVRYVRCCAMVRGHVCVCEGCGIPCHSDDLDAEGFCWAECHKEN